MTRPITDQDRQSLSKHIPLAHLLPMAGEDVLPMSLINHPVVMDTTLKRQVLKRLHGGELCLVYDFPVSEPPLDVGKVLAKYMEAA